MERRRIGRITIDEQPDALIVTAPFLSRGRAVVLALAIVLLFAVLGASAFGAAGQRRTFDVLGLAVLAAVCGYPALLLALNRTVTTIRRARIVIRRGPIPMWPATTIDVTHIEDVHAAVRKGVVGRGGRMALDAIEASLVGGRSTTLIDDAGDADAAQRVAALITTWIWSHVP